MKYKHALLWTNEGVVHIANGKGKAVLAIKCRIRQTIDLKCIAARIGKDRKENVWTASVYGCVGKYTVKDFDTLEEAEKFADSLLLEFGVKLLDEKMKVLL